MLWVRACKVGSGQGGAVSSAAVAVAAGVAATTAVAGPRGGKGGETGVENSGWIVLLLRVVSVIITVE